MSKKWFSGDGSKLFWEAIHKSKDKNLLYKYGCKAQELEASHDDLLAACEKSQIYLDKLKEMGRLHADGIMALEKINAAIAKGKAKE